MPKRHRHPAITKRFLQVMAEHTGPGRRWRGKIDFAADIGIFSQEIYKFENGLGDMQLHHAIRLHQLLKVNMNWLILGKGPRYMINGAESKDKTLANLMKKIHKMTGE